MQDFPLIIDIEIKPDRGEDASVIFPESSSIEDSTDYCAIAVFDGLGGRSAGYDGLTGGQIASEIAAKQTDKFLKQWRGKITQESIIELQDNISRFLQEEANNKLKPSRLKGSLVQKRLCTTFALASINNHYLTVDLAWMGDSRIYFLSPELGLQQLTKDDIVVEKDAFEMIREDPPLSQYLTADMETEWGIHFKSEQFSSKGCILACTDGCFQYLSAPWKFEQLLLETLSQSSNAQDWQNLLLEKYNEFKQDDVSLLLYPLDFKDFEDLKDSYSNRLNYLQNLSQDDESHEILLQKWQKYRVNYEAKLNLTDTIENNNLASLDDSEDQDIPEQIENEASESKSLESDEHEIEEHPSDTVFDNQQEETSTDLEKESSEHKTQETEIEELHQQALEYNQQGQIEQSIDCYTRILNLQPNHIKANYNLGIIYLEDLKKLFKSFSLDKKSTYQKAVNYLMKVVNQHSNYYLNAIQEIVNLCWDHHDYQTIFELYQIIKIDINDITDEECLVKIAEVLARFNNLKDSKNVCRFIFHSLNDDNPDILYLLGDFAEKEEDLESALDFFQKSHQSYWKEYQGIRTSRVHDRLSQSYQRVQRVQRELGRQNSFYH